MEKGKFARRFKELLKITIINKDKLIEEIKNEKVEEVHMTNVYFNGGLDKAIEIINKHG